MLAVINEFAGICFSVHRGIGGPGCRASSQERSRFEKFDFQAYTCERGSGWESGEPAPKNDNLWQSYIIADVPSMHYRPQGLHTAIGRPIQIELCRTLKNGCRVATEDSQEIRKLFQMPYGILADLIINVADEIEIEEIFPRFTAQGPGFDFYEIQIA